MTCVYVDAMNDVPLQTPGAIMVVVEQPSNRSGEEMVSNGVVVVYLSKPLIH